MRWGEGPHSLPLIADPVAHVVGGETMRLVLDHADQQTVVCPASSSADSASGQLPRLVSGPQHDGLVCPPLSAARRFIRLRIASPSQSSYELARMVSRSGSRQPGHLSTGTTEWTRIICRIAKQRANLQISTPLATQTQHGSHTLLTHVEKLSSL